MSIYYAAVNVWTAHQPVPQLASAPSAIGDVGEQRGMEEARQNWQALAVAEWRRATDEMRTWPQRRFAERLLALTGCAVDERAIAETVATGCATAVVDGVVFRWRGDWRGDVLAVVRPCAYCGTGSFESLPVANLSDLGYALALWEPLHADCAPVDPADDTSW